jgi:hypothetical protein
MTAHRGTGPERGDPATLVWIDSEEALFVRWEGAARIERMVPDVGGGGVAEDQIARERLERLRRFVHDVAAHVPAGDDVRIVGPNDVRLRLGRLLRDEDRRVGRHRLVDTRAAGPLTERQLVEHVREIAGDPPPRVVPAR